MKTSKLRFKRFVGLSLGIVLCLNLAALQAKPVTMAEKQPPKTKKYYQVVLVWVKDPQKYQEYVQKLGPVVSKYGSQAERIVSPVSTFFAVKKADELSKPDMVNIVYYESKAAYQKFENDPEFLALKDLRAEAIDIAGIDGEAIDNAPVLSGGVEDRLYMIEFLNYKNKKTYEDYLVKTKDYYKRHQLITERAFKVDRSFGNIERPHVVNIKYLKKASKRPEMESDKEHAQVEKLYGEMLTDLIWIEGKAAFVNME